MLRKNIIIENAPIRFRNFAGKAGDFNPEGVRNFCVFLDNELATSLKADGWNVKELTPRDPDEPIQPYLPVAVAFANYPPKIVMMSSRGKTLLDEASINILDWAELQSVDLIIQPYNWVMYEGKKNERRGVKAYLKSMYVTIYEDELAKKYVNVPDSAETSVGGCGECDTCDETCKCGD